MEIIAQEGYKFFGGDLSYSLGKVSANTRSVVSFSKEADGWAHEAFHHIDLFCKATDNKMFSAIYEALPRDNKFRRIVEGVIKQHYSRITTHTQEEDLQCSYILIQNLGHEYLNLWQDFWKIMFKAQICLKTNILGLA